MSVKVAFMFIAPEVDSDQHRAQIDTPIVKLSVVGVKNYAEAQKAAIQLVEEGISAIELCAGFGTEGTALISKVVGEKAVVGAVRFDLHPAFNNQSGDKVFA